MIKLYINGALREDVWIQAGGTLEQTEEHTTESNISVRVPIVSDNLAVYDYVQIYDEDTIIFAGNILSLNQQMLDSGYTGLDFRVYDLVMACNADLVANILVDMSFPAGATVTQILKGNHNGDAWYNESLGEFAGVIDTRIVPEGCTAGTVANYNTTALESTSYVWGETVKELLDNLAELTLSYWEITNEKVFNFQPKTSNSIAPIRITEESEIFALEVENDSLATYSAVRVVGGEGELLAQSYTYPTELFYFSDEKTLTCTKKLASVDTIIGLDLNGNVAIAYVGFNGIHDDDAHYTVLMSYGGDTLKVKDDVNFKFNPSGGTLLGVSLLQKITARAVSEEACSRIREKRGGTGVIEYILEDETISNYNDAMLNATRFLDSHKNNIQTIKFSTFKKGLAVGQRITGNIPYYKISGSYYVGAVVVNFVLDDTQYLIAQYDIECTSSLYRDNYKTLFYFPQTISFEVGEDDGNINGFTYSVEVDIIITLKTQISHIPTWEEVTGQQWSTINGITWNDFYRFTEGVTLTGNYATEIIRGLFAQFAQGDLFKGSPDYQQIGIQAANFNMALSIYMTGDGQQASALIQDTTPTVGTQFTNSYYVNETEAQFHIDKLSMPMYAGGMDQNSMEIPVDIDKSPSNPQGQYAMTIGITVDFQ